MLMYNQRAEKFFTAIVALAVLQRINQRTNVPPNHKPHTQQWLKNKKKMLLLERGFVKILSTFRR
jgi:hypothetical protein